MEIKDIFLNSEEYFPVDFKKTIIYLHHTCGSCFVGETLIDLVDGSSVRMDELIIGNKYWTYGCDSEGNTKVVDCVALGETKKVNELIEITLDNGKIERCTIDHLWMSRDGEYKKALDLKEGDSLMPLYKRFDKNGKLIKEYDNISKAAKENDNISKAAKENNLNQSHISHALTDSPSCGGYVWVYKNSDYTNILKEKLSKIKRQYILNQLDLKTGEILRTFNSIKEAQELTNIRHIGDVLSGKRNYAGGYKWSKSL